MTKPNLMLTARFAVELLISKPLIAGILILSSWSAFAGSFPQGGQETYESRPDILTLPATAHREIDRQWHEAKKAHFAFVAQLLELYPDREIYFLARDSEHLFDAAKLATEGSVDFTRVHLLNVSRANMEDRLLKSYLKQNGISEDSLTAGRKILFVDTGFSGTISRVIMRQFSAQASANIKTHLIVSSNKDHPSSRVFLSYLNPAVNEEDPASMHGTILTYEHMPRYTDRSMAFAADENGVLHAMSSQTGAEDGSVSKVTSRQFMEDLKFSWSQSGMQTFFARQRHVWRSMVAVVSEGREAAIENFKRRLAEPSDQTQNEAMVRDLIEAQNQSTADAGLSLFEVGLKVTNPTTGSKKNELIAKFPQWAPVLENPDSAIPKLFETGNWQMIGNLIDASVDDEINKILATLLFAGPAVGIKADCQLLMIERADSKFMSWIIDKALRHELRPKMTAVIEAISYRLIELGAPHSSSLGNALYDLYQVRYDWRDVSHLMKVLMKVRDEKFLGANSLNIGKLRLIVSDWADVTYQKPNQNEVVKFTALILSQAETSWEVHGLQSFFKSYRSGYVNDPDYRALAATLEIEDVIARRAAIQTIVDQLGQSSSVVHHKTGSLPSSGVGRECKDLFRQKLN